VVTIYTIFFNILTLWVLPTECICVFHMVFTVNSDSFPKQHWPVGPCSGDIMFPARYDLNCYVLFKRNSVFKGLTPLGYKARQSASFVGKVRRTHSLSGGRIHDIRNEKLTCAWLSGVFIAASFRIPKWLLGCMWCWRVKIQLLNDDILNNTAWRN
jgi:hypothetical protein